MKLDYLTELNELSDKMIECLKKKDENGFFENSQKYLSALSRNISTAIGVINPATTPFIIEVLTRYIEAIGELHPKSARTAELIKNRCQTETIITQMH